MNTRRTLFIFALLFVYTFAMVPKHRFPRNANTICAPQTPCAWDMYKDSPINVYMSVVNDYCVCGENTSCVYHVTDKIASALVYKCKVADT